MRWLLYIFLLVSILVSLAQAAKGLDNDCVIDDDWTDTYEYCSLSDKECIHKDVFPLEMLEFFGSIVLGIMIALSNAGGIGGGGIIVPIGIIFFRFRTKQAVALSNFWIFTASWVRFAINYNKKHPNKDAKLIDYSIIMIMFPMVLLGSLFGVQINLIIPESVLLGGLTLILIFLSFNSVKTSLKIRKKENADRAEETKVDPDHENNAQEMVENPSKSVEDHKEEGDSEEDKKEAGNSDSDAKEHESHEYLSQSRDGPSTGSRIVSVLPPINGAEGDIERKKKSKKDHSNPIKSKESSDKDAKSTLTSKDGKAVDVENPLSQKSSPGEDVHPELLKIIKKEQTHLKPATLILFPFLFIVLIFLILLRGTSSVDSIIGVKSCSAMSFVILAILVLFYVGMTILNTVLVKKEYSIKVKHGYKFVEGDLKWESKLLIQFVLCALGAGFIAGTVGLGGGVIFNPLLLSFKVPPQVASSTGMFMIMFGSLSNIFLYIMADYLHIGFGFWWGAYTAVGTAAGIIFVNKLIKKTGRTSYLAFILTFVIILSAIIVPIFGTVQLVQDANDGENLMEFGSFWD